MYSASTMDRATEFYFLLKYEISAFPRNWHMLDVLFQLTLFSTKLVSLYPIKSNEVSLGY